MRKSTRLLICYTLFSLFNTVNPLLAQISYLNVSVRDSLRGIPLSGASVKLIYPKDTVIQFSTNDGNADFYTIPLQNYTLTVTYMGYKTITKKYTARREMNYLTINMIEDVTNLNQIIVKGKEILMIIKQDTVRYNMNAFKTIEGDNLIEAIKMIPGVTVDENGISHLGKSINRVYVNNTLLFGRDKPMVALNNLKADEVKNVDIYEETTDNDKFLGVKNGEKQKVMNVITKKKIETVINATLMSGAGVESKSSEKKYKLMANSGFYNIVRNFSARIYGENINSGITNQPSRNTGHSVDINYSEKFSKKILFFSNLSYQRSYNKSNNLTEREYFPSESYLSRYSSENTIAKTKSNNINLFTGLQYTIDSTNQVTVGVAITKNRSDNFNNRFGYQSEDDIVVNRINNFYSSVSKQFSFIQNCEWMHRLKKRGSFLVASLGIEQRSSSGDGWQIDTSMKTTYQINNIKDSEGSGNLVRTAFNYGIPLWTGTFNLMYELSFENGINRSESINRLTYEVDTINTFDYGLKNLVNKLSFNYAFKIKKHTGSLRMAVNSTRNYRDEQFPGSYIFSKQFYGGDLSSNFKTEINKRNFLDIIYTIITTYPSLENLRGVVNNSNPLILTAGNPNLFPTNRHNLQLSYSFFSERGNSLILNVSGYNSVNAVSVKKFYFNEDTYIAKYNYTFRKGSTLNTRVNTQGSYQSTVNLKYSHNLSALKAMTIITLKYNFTQNPFYNDQKLVFQRNNSYTLTANIMSNLSRQFSYTLYFESKKGYISNNTLNKTSFFNQTVYLDVRAIILKRISFANDCNYNYYIKPSLPNSKINSFVWNFSVGYKLKKEKGEISFIAKDILNNANKLVITEKEDYIQSTYNNDIIKQIFMLSFTYNLNTRK